MIKVVKKSFAKYRGDLMAAKVAVAIQNNHDNNKTIISYNISRQQLLLFIGSMSRGKSALINFLCERRKNPLPVASYSSSVVISNSNHSPTFVDTPGFCENTAHARTTLSMRDFLLKELCIKEAGPNHFNTMPKRPKVDKFKHRCGPKAQKISIKSFLEKQYTINT